ncbi:MAG: hypothetical protein HDR71_13315 [Lachnospiraceae bacterium]|nr:hypothetical protein [Lachnospiraceae bacterium]
MGDIYREEKNKSSNLEVSDYYENADPHDIENYRGLYRAGLVYEEKGNFNFIWYQDARKKYDAVIDLISAIDTTDRTPQEFEYFYKAHYRRIKMSIRFDCSNGSMTYEREKYCKELQWLISACNNFKDLVFLNKLYGNGDTFLKAKNLMKEKMEEVKAWAKNLIAELENI